MCFFMYGLKQPDYLRENFESRNMINLITVILSLIIFALAQLVFLNLLGAYASTGVALYFAAYGSAAVLTGSFFFVMFYTLRILHKYVSGQQKYDYSLTIDSAAAAVTDGQSDRDSASRLLDSINSQVKISSAAIFVGNDSDFVMKAFCGVKAQFYNYHFDKSSLLVRWLKYNKRALFKSELIREYDSHLITREEIHDLRKLSQEVKDLQIHVTIPVVVDNKLRGILIIGKPVSKLRFSAGDIDYFSRIARQIVINNDHLQLGTKIKSNMNEMSILKKIGRIINSATDINIALNMLNKAVVESVGLSRSVFMLFDDSMHLVPRATYGVETAAYKGMRIPAQVHRLEKVLNGRTVVVVEKKHKKLMSLFTDIIFDNGVVIALRRRGVLVGVILMDSRPDRTSLSTADEQLLEVLAAQVELGIERLNLVSDRELSQKQVFTFQEEADGLRSYTESILYNISNAIVATDQNDIVTVFNKAAQDFFGCSGETVLGRNINIFVNKDPLFGCALDLSRTEPFTFDGVINTATGQVPIKGNFLILRRKGRIRGKLLVLSDVSQIKDLEKQLYFSDRLSSMGTMTASMLHEIKNPITSLKMFSHVMSQKYADPGFWELYGVIVAEEIERLDLLVNNFLGFSKKQDCESTEVNFHDLVSKVLGLLSVNLKHNRIMVSVNIPENLVVSGDEKSLQQVLLNILINSEQAFREGQVDKLLSIRSSVRGNTACISITDNGRGISDQEKDKIFKPFFTTKQEGTGLGLFISSKIISDMQGQLSVKSKLGFGTEFRIELPVFVQQMILT